MIKCYNVIVAVKRIFLISGNKFSSFIDSQFSFFTNFVDCDRIVHTVSIYECQNIFYVSGLGPVYMEWGTPV